MSDRRFEDASIYALAGFHNKVVAITSAAGRPVDAAIPEWIRDQLARRVLGEQPDGLRALTRPEASEVLDCVGEIAVALESLPYRQAAGALSLLDAVRSNVEGTFPGGYAGQCEFCSSHIGVDEIGVTDVENGGFACKPCSPSAEEIAKQQAEILSEKHASGEWIEWHGGSCPVDGDTFVQVRVRGFEDAHYPDRAGSYAWHLDGDAGDILEYRVAPPEHLASVTITRNDPPADPTSLPDDAIPYMQPIFDTEAFEPPAVQPSSSMADRRVPRFDPAALIDWHSNADAAQAIRDGKLPEGHRVEGGVLIVSGSAVKAGPSRAASVLYSSFSEIRRDNGDVLKTADKNWAAPEAEELQLLRQLMRGPIFTNHTATRRVAARLDDRADVMVIEAMGRGLIPNRAAIEITAKGKRRLDRDGYSKGVGALIGESNG